MMTPTRTLQVIDVAKDFGLDPNSSDDVIGAFITWAHINDSGDETPADLFDRFKLSEVGRLHLE